MKETERVVVTLSTLSQFAVLGVFLIVFVCIAMDIGNPSTTTTISPDESLRQVIGSEEMIDLIDAAIKKCEVLLDEVGHAALVVEHLLEKGVTGPSLEKAVTHLAVANEKLKSHITYQQQLKERIEESEITP